MNDEPLLGLSKRRLCFWTESRPTEEHQAKSVTHNIINPPLYGSSNPSTTNVTALANSPITDSNINKTMAHAKKHVRFSPSVSMQPDNDAAFTMLALHQHRDPVRQSRSSSSSLKRKVTQTEWTSSKLRIVSPNDDEPQRGSVLARVSRNAAIPAPPFLYVDEEDCVAGPETRNATTKCVAKKTNPLDLLSTVSSQIVPDSAQKPGRTNPSQAANAVQSSNIGDKSGASALQQGYKAYPNGSKYLGHFLHTQRHGFGICHYPNGHVYTGYWSNGQRSGVGLMRYANGDSYEGEWKSDVREGRGVFYYNDGIADVSLWKGGESVYGVRWSDDRKIARKLVDGMEGQFLGMTAALSIGREVGVDDVPERL